MSASPVISAFSSPVISTVGRDLLSGTTRFLAIARNDKGGRHRDLPRCHLDQRERSPATNNGFSCWRSKEHERKPSRPTPPSSRPKGEISNRPCRDLLLGTARFSLRCEI